MIRLTPIIDTDIKEFIYSEQLHSLTNGFGTPLNIIFPEKLAKNVKSFNTIFNEHSIKGKIYYAHKANKSLALVKQANHAGIFIDVASKKELHDALISGFTGNEIEVTGPKEASLLLLAMQHNCLIQVDNLSELDQIISLKKGLNNENKVNILIRFSGFSASNTKIITKDSRFGIPIKNYNVVLEILSSHKEELAFKGFSYHLDSNTPKEKAIALENILDLYNIFSDAGLVPEIVNIGGGFKINYIASEKEWNDYLGNLQQAALGNIPPITWHNNNFGYYKDDNRVRGNSSFYEYFTKTAGPKYLNEILSLNLPSLAVANAGQLISELMLQLYIEPGRALLDQVGITVSRVTYIKKSPHGQTLVGLDMNRSNLASTDQEMMLDPIVVYKKHEVHKKEYGVYFVGNLCLESDFIYKHKTFLNQLPDIGDLVVFVNTAAYNSDFTESATIQQKIAKKIAVIKRGDSFHWFEDEQYNPYLLEKNV